MIIFKYSYSQSVQKGLLQSKLTLAKVLFLLKRVYAAVTIIEKEVCNV